MEEKTTFYAGTVALEGLLHKKSGSRGVVITHPHPEYGGNMHNNVVMAIARAYQKLDYTTLRFNFRGVGGSQGSYSAGIGEQQDAVAALAYLADLGINRVDLAGYSFGAWVNGHLNCAAAGIADMVMISPPVAFIDFASVAAIDCLSLVITGSRDEIAPVEMIRQSYREWNTAAHVEVIDGADHFYGGYENKLAQVLLSHHQD
ncbi:Alpha/beta hydrolase [Olavius algarvensis Delta 1 endosymbiont]|nr:Alpha/beta hydrolase [Olavius algarvensis Delta 1 endosymbiont]